MTRRGTPELLIGALLAVLLGSYVWYTHRVVVDLREAAERSTRMFAHIYRAYADTSKATDPLFDLLQDIRDQGVPAILIDPSGHPAGHMNLPFDPSNTIDDDDPRVSAYITTLDAENEPVRDPLIGSLHFGNTPIVEGLRVIPELQALTAVILVLAWFYIVRTRNDAARERLWAGMARESAHQLGTPLSSLSGWIELLEDREDADPRLRSTLTNMRGDLARLDRVAHRFERIGRELRVDQIEVGAILDGMAVYFRARVPTLANAVRIESEIAPDLPTIQGDAVLIEWALEVLTKNAIDALAGRGGSVRLSAIRTDDDGVRIRVEDDGPGVPRELRDRIFDPGFSTKKSGWGIGLSLARRIVEETHSGRLVLVPGDRGATFEIILH